MIKMDHRSLKELMVQIVQTQEQQYYLTKLMGFDYEIIYRTGKSNGVADALSRQELVESQFNSLTHLHSPVIAAIKSANGNMEELKACSKSSVTVS